MPTRVDGTTYKVTLTEVSFAPDMMLNLISKSRVRKAGCKIFTDDNNLGPSKGVTRIVQKQNEKTTIVCVEISEGLCEAVLSVQIACAVRIVNLDVWHDRLCHVFKKTIVQARNISIGLNEVNLVNHDVCECC